MKALSPESVEILVPSLQELTIRYADPYTVPRPIKSVANCPLKKLILFESFLKDQQFDHLISKLSLA